MLYFQNLSMKKTVIAKFQKVKIKMFKKFRKKLIFLTVRIKKDIQFLKEFKNLFKIKIEIIKSIQKVMIMNSKFKNKNKLNSLITK